MEATVLTQITSAITSNMSSATEIAVAAGLALIGLGFVGFVIRQARKAAAGRS